VWTYSSPLLATIVWFERIQKKGEERRNSMTGEPGLVGNGGVLKSYILYVGKKQTALLGATTLIKVNEPTCFPEFF